MKLLVFFSVKSLRSFAIMLNDDKPDLPRDIIFSIIRDAEISYGGSWHQLHKKKFQGVMNHFNTPIFRGKTLVGHGVWMASTHWGSHPEEAGDFDDEMNSWVFNLVEKGWEFWGPTVNRLYGYGSPGRRSDESSLLMPLMGFVFREEEWEPPDEHLSHEWGYRNDREILLPGIGTGAYCVHDIFFSVASIYTSPRISNDTPTILQ